MSVIKEVTLTGFTKVASLFSVLLLTILLPKLIGLHEFGMFMIGYALCLGISTVARAGLSTALVRWGSKYKKGVQTNFLYSLFLTFILLSVILSLLIVILVVYLLLFFEIKYSLDQMVPFILSAPFSVVFFISASYLKLMNKSYITPILETAGVIGLTLVIGISCAELSFHNYTYALFSWCFFFSHIILALFLIFYMRRGISSAFKLTISRIKYNELKNIYFSTLLDFALIDYANYVMQYGVIIYLGIIFSESVAGAYSILFRISLVLNFVVLVFNSVLVSRFARLYVDSKIDRLKVLACSSSAAMTLLAMILLAILFYNLDFILGYFSAGLLEFKMELYFLFLAQFVNVLTGNVGPILNMTGNQRYVRSATLTSILFTIFLLWPLSNYGGITGFVIAISFGVIVKNIYLYFLLRQKLGFWILPVVEIRRIYKH
jgi:O-antigen/teichoic acid export membrane protein